jgi:two-component system nitrate/nitrite response regulator NarL
MVLDRDRLYAQGLTALLRDGTQDVACFHTLQALQRAVRDSGPPDLIVVDPGPSPGTTDAGEPGRMLRSLRAVAGDTPLAVLTAEGEEGDLLAEGMAVGIVAHLSKDLPQPLLRRALGLVLQGQAVLPEQALPRLGPGWQPAAPGTAAVPAAVPAAGPDGLSRRESQILSCLLAGLANKEIARRLAISESTVKMHFKNVLRKTRSANRTQAAVWALEHGIAPLA